MLRRFLALAAGGEAGGTEGEEDEAGGLGDGGSDTAERFDEAGEHRAAIKERRAKPSRIPAMRGRGQPPSFRPVEIASG